MKPLERVLVQQVDDDHDITAILAETRLPVPQLRHRDGKGLLTFCILLAKI